jgi:hypothetical protein
MRTAGHCTKRTKPPVNCANGIRTDLDRALQQAVAAERHAEKDGRVGQAQIDRQGRLERTPRGTAICATP